MDTCSDLAVIDENELSLDKKDWKVIGYGGFGQVYGVRHLQWRRDVAIKVLSLDDGSSDKNLDRESKLMRWAASPHVIQVLGVFRGRLPSVSDIKIGLVMELMERGSLASLQKLNHPLPWSLVFRLAHQVALGMKHLHSLKPDPIIHKDLKPGNVLLDTDLNVKITDFGLSKFVNYSTTAHIKTAGTTSYMPPEAFSLSYKTTPAFDVYSYGILLCSIVKGKEPYDTLPDIIEFLVPQGQRPSLEVDPKQATGLEDLVKLMERCWHQEPDKRPLFPECTAETEALYEKHEPSIMDAVHQVVTKLFPPPSLQDQGESVMDVIDPILTLATTLYPLCEEVKANKKQCTRLEDRVKGLEQVLRATKRKGAQISPEEETALEELKLTLDSAAKFVKQYNSDKEYLFKRIVKTYNHGYEFEILNERLNATFQVLSLNLQVEMDHNLHKLFDAASQREEDEADRKEDCAEIVKMLQHLMDQLEALSLKLDANSMLNVKHMIEMLCFQGADGLIVTEYCEKGSLREVLDNSKLKLPWVRKARMCLDAAQGIYILHQTEQKSKIHGGITSDNFMVAESYRVKLGGVQWGQTETSLRRNPVCVSLRYRSPEQLLSLNHPYCKICEIYSLGIVLWEIATRMNPLADCTTPKQIFKRAKEKQVPEPLPEDCPKKLGQLINDCRAYEPFERPTAGVLVDKLWQVVEQLEEE